MSRNVALACCLGLTFTLLPCTSLPCQTLALPAAAERPTPEDWDQWQPQIDTADARLNATFVSVWEEEVTAGHLLASLSDQSALKLTAVSELLPIRITIFARSRMLGGLMSALAHLFDAYWAFPRHQSPEARQYCLVPHETHIQPFDELYQQDLSSKAKRARAAPHRAARDQRLELYHSALNLTPQQLLDRYEDSDPWLCADLLNPKVRPMIEYAFSLTEPQKDQLLTEGDFAQPLRSLPSQFQAHLADWSKGRWGGPATLKWAPDPDRLPRFTTPEDRWENAVVSLRWSRMALQLQLDLLPDVARFDADVIRTPAYPPYRAREQLLSLGHREDTPEYRDAAMTEALEWAESQPASPHAEPPLGFLAPQPNQTDPHLTCELDWRALQGELVSVPDALALAPRQCRLAVVAHYLPPDAWPPCQLHAPTEESEHNTLGALLNAIRRERGGAWSWNFYGNYLVAEDPQYLATEASMLPPDALSEWEQALRPGNTLSLDDLASRLAALNTLQVQYLEETFLAAQEIPIYGIHFYSSIRADQREQLTDEEGLPFSDLSPDQQREVLATAGRFRPWLASTDLANTILRSLPRKLSTGQAGLSLIFEYHFPDSPSDRDVLFTSPFQITMSSR